MLKINFDEAKVEKKTYLTLVPPISSFLIDEIAEDTRSF